MTNKLTALKIMSEIEKNLETIKKYGVKRIGLFGSFVKKKDDGQSDLDFLVEFDDNTFDNYMDLKFFLEDLFGRKVDLVIEDNVKPALQYIKEEALYAEGL
ncbi:MAG: nucleotidyltransferase family protein [Candidatus Woesearchaeota archaeon]